VEDSQPSDDHTNLKFSVSISTDRAGFFRRACDSCGRQFKTQIDPADLQWALSAQCQRVGLDVGDRNPDHSAQETLLCPFCGHEVFGSDMHTDDTVEYLRRLVHREYVLPRMNNAFSALEDSLGRDGRSGGFLSVSLTFTHTPSLLPVRPLHGPEPADMNIVSFLCCAKRIKVPETWSTIEACCYCKAPVALV
jgi:hypothetical protein